VIDFGKDIGMGIEMQKANRLPFRQFAATKGLNNPAGDRMIAANRKGPHPRVVDAFIKSRDAFDAIFIVIGSRKRDIARVDNRRGRPRIEANLTMDTALYRSDISHRPRPKMLIAFRGAIAGGMRHANQGDISGSKFFREGIDMGATKQRRYPPPIEIVHHAGIMFLRHGGLP